MDILRRLRKQEFDCLIGINLLREGLDLPGHGHSEHRHPGTRYHFIDYLFDIDSALDALGWSDCHLLGHSMGAAIVAAYAAGAPGRVRSAVLLDSIGPLAGEVGRTAERLRRSLAKYRKGARRATADLSEAAARLICERSARAADGKFTWRSDPALNWVSALLMTEEQALDLLRHVEAPVLTLHVTPESPWFTRERIEARKAALAGARHLTLEGHHHFHMDAPGGIAATIQSFILEQEQHIPAIRTPAWITVTTGPIHWVDKFKVLGTHII